MQYVPQVLGQENQHVGGKAQGGPQALGREDRDVRHQGSGPASSSTNKSQGPVKDDARYKDQAEGGGRVYTPPEPPDNSVLG